MTTSAQPASLSAARRSEDLSTLVDRANSTDCPVDIVVIGAGITGVGIALDAATRGLDTVLIDAHDLAFGTSRWSSKLAHGGLRYLASGNVGIARRSAVERGILMTRTAPHLTRALPQVVPVFRDSAPANAVLPRAGFIAGDGLRIAAGTSSSVLPRSRTISARRTAEFSPTVRREGLVGGHLNYDGQLIDDARLVTAVARTAAQNGAMVLTRVRALSSDATSVTLRDEIGGDEFRLPTRCVVNATGVWAGTMDESIRVRPSRGTHLVFDAETFGNPTGALTVPVPGETNRFCFVMPEQLGRVYLGLTDEEERGPIPDVPEVPEEDIDFLLSVINTALDTPVTRDDVKGSFAGLRPLIDNSGGRTADLSREHVIVEREDGLITVCGGKLTEYRLMAKEVMDRVAQRLGVTTTCTTDSVPLVGAPGNPVSGPTTGADLAGLPNSLISRHGLEAPEVVASCPVDRPLDRVGELDITRAELAWAVTHEGAVDATDVLERRTRIGLVPADRAAVEDEARDIVESVLSAS